MEAAQASVIEQMATEVSHRYHELKNRDPRRRIDFSLLLLEVVKGHGFQGEQVAPIRSAVSKLFAARRKARNVNMGRAPR